MAYENRSKPQVGLVFDGGFDSGFGSLVVVLVVVLVVW